MPDQAKERLSRLAVELRECNADVRWVQAAQMHVTLKFLGNVEPHEMPAIDETLVGIAAAALPTSGRLRDLGSFPHLRRPRVLWVGVATPDERFARLNADLEGGLSRIGFPPEKRRFRPHVTLGRVRGGRGIGRLVEAIEARRSLDLGPLEIDALTLFESRPRRGGARYTELGVYPLGAAPGG